MKTNRPFLHDLLLILPTQLRRALRAIRLHDDGMHPATQRARLDDARRLFTEYVAAQRIHSDSVTEMLHRKGSEAVDMDDPAARDAFHERIAHDLPALEKRQHRELAIEAYRCELQAIEKTVQARENSTP